METTYLGKFNWGRKQQTIIPEKILICNIRIWYCFALNHILELLNSKVKCTMLIYAFFYTIYIYSLFNSELRLLSYEIKHFSMAFEKINSNSI